MGCLYFWAADPFIDKSYSKKLKDLEPQNKGHTNFYECFDLTKKCWIESHYKNRISNSDIVMHGKLDNVQHTVLQNLPHTPLQLQSMTTAILN